MISKKILNNKKSIVLSIKAMIGIVLVIVIYLSIDDKQGIASAFNNANWVNLSLAFLMIIINILIQFIRYFWLLRSAEIDVSCKTAFASLIFGFTLGFVTPGNIGELGKAIYFKNLNRWEASGAVVVDKLVNMVATYFVGSITLIIIMVKFASMPKIFSFLYLSIFIFSFFLFLFFLWNPYLIYYVVRKLKTKLTFQKKVFQLVRAVNRISTKALLTAIFIGIIWLAVLVLQYHMVLLGFTTVSVKASLLAVPAMLMVKMALPVTLGDLGIREGALVFFYGFFGINQEFIIYSGLIILIFNMVLPAMAGLFVLKNVEFQLFEKRS